MRFSRAAVPMGAAREYDCAAISRRQEID